MKVKHKKRQAGNIRARLIEKGTSLGKWAKENNYSYNTVYKAANGERHGPLSQEILRKLKRHEARPQSRH